MISNSLVEALILFIIAMFTALLAGPFAIRLARRIGAVDQPQRGEHNINPNQTPLAGGMILFAAVGIAGAVKLGINANPQVFQSTWHILLAAGIIFLFGVWDDIRGLSALAKLGGQLLGTLVMIALGEHVHLFQNNIFNYLLTGFWLVGITNAFNLIDSREGLSLGTGLIISLTLTVLSFQSQQLDILFMGVLWLGACAGTFYYNRLPGKVFMGDAGAQFLGFSLAVMAMSYNPLGFKPTNSWFLPILLFAVPIFDTMLVTFSRMRCGMPIFHGDTNHTFHRLERITGSTLRAIFLMLLVSLLLNTLAYVLLHVSPLAANISFGLVVLAGAGAMVLLYKLDEKAKREKPQAG